MMPARRASSLALLTAGLLLTAPATALADTETSSNWSGYAAHRAGVRFRRVSASWTEPTVVCPRGQDTYSSFWVGLGGFSTNAPGLEQIGTELDCTRSGRARSTAWYELVPAPSRPISMTVKPGDEMSASVVVVGHRVAVRLQDHTRGESFFKQLSTRSIDVSAAEWITEAPSTCDAAGACQPLPLANYGSAQFTTAAAQDASGQVGTISRSTWKRTRLILSQSPSPFSSLNVQRTSTPSMLQSSGSAFAVRYGQSAGGAAARLAARSDRGTWVLQPGGGRR